jgi:hypothetical protein
MTLKQDPNDKYKEYEVDFHGLEPHEENEISPSEGKVNDWHERHKDKVLDVFCDTHPDAPQCRVYDD